MKNAFTYMFKDNGIQKKFLALWAIYLATAILKGILPMFGEFSLPYIINRIAAIFLLLISTGYGVACTQSLIKKEDTLPFLNIKNIISGFKATVAVLLLAASIIIGLYLVIVGVRLINPIASVYTFKILGGIIFLTVVFYLNGFSRYFAKTESWLSFFQFKKVTNQIKENTSTYLKAFFCYIGFALAIYLFKYLILGGLCMVLSQNVMTIYSVIESLLTTYVAFFTYYLIANCIKEEEVV